MTDSFLIALNNHKLSPIGENNMIHEFDVSPVEHDRASKQYQKLETKIKSASDYFTFWWIGDEGPFFTLKKHIVFDWVDGKKECGHRERAAFMPLTDARDAKFEYEIDIPIFDLKLIPWM